MALKFRLRLRAPRLTLKVTGGERLAATLRDFPGRAMAALGAGLFIEAEKTMSASKKLTPVDEGILRASGHVQLPVIQDARVTVKFGYGGPAGAGGRLGAGAVVTGEGLVQTQPPGQNREDVGYAVFVHEDTDVFGLTPGGGSRNTGPGAIRKRRKRRFVGQAKYLSVPLRARAQGRLQRILAVARKHLRGRRV